MAPERLARSGAISLVGSAFAALAALVLTSIVGNSLGAGGTGIFFQAMAIFTILTQVLRLGTNSGIVRFLAGERALHRHGSEWRIVLYAMVPVAVLSGLVALAVWIWADGLASWLTAPGEEATLAGLLRAMVPFVVVGALLGVAQITARMVRGVAAFTLLQSVLLPATRLATVLFAVLAGATAWAAFEAWLIPLPFWLAVTVVVITAPLIRDFGLRSAATHPERVRAAGFWRFNAPRAVSSALETALEWSDVLLVAALASPAAAGVYAVATRAVRAGGIVDKAMRVAVAPTISSLLTREQHGTAADLHTRVVRAMVLLNWPFYMLLISMGPAILAIFGPEFVVGWGPMVLLAGAMMFQTSAGMLQSILLQGGRSSWQMYNKACVLAVSIVGNIALVPPLGIWGAAVTWLVAVVTDNLLAAVQVHRGIGVHLQPLRLLPAAIAPTLVFGVGGLLFTWWGGTSIGMLALAIAVLGAIYAAILWLLRKRLGIVGLWTKVPVIGRRA